MHNILRMGLLKSRTGLGRSTLYALMAKNEFPQSIRLSARSVGWLADEVDGWIARRVEKSRALDVEGQTKQPKQFSGSVAETVARIEPGAK